MKHLDGESHRKQPGCMWGLVHVLDYHNVKKMIHHRKHEHDTRSWSHETSIYHNDSYEEKLLDEKETLHHSTKSSRGSKKRSLRARIKALISEEISKDNTNTRGFAFKPSLQRTYSIHHLESFDDGLNKICTDWKNQVIFLPKDADNAPSQSSDTTQINSTVKDEVKLDSKQNPDVFEIFKVDKELLLKNLQESEKGIANFSRSALGLNTNAKFSKSRSFPVAYLADGRKLKPSKLESKQKEVWSIPKENKSGTVNQVWPGESFEEIASTEAKNGTERKRTNRRSFSLTESLDKYGRLFENSLAKDAKLNSSKSLKLSNDYGLDPLYFRRIHYLSYVDSDFSNSNFEVTFDDQGLVVIEKDMQNSEDESDEKNKSVNGEEMQIEEDSGSSLQLDDVKEEAYKLKKDEISDKIVTLEPEKCPKKKYSDKDYVKLLLDQSGIAVDGSEMTWHSSDVPLGPQLFEDLEARWPHEQDELNGWPDFHGCWDHKMVFDLVNEVLVEVYDVSLPYYPKALSSSCHVRPFPVGDCIIEEVCTSIGAFRYAKADEMQSLDCIVGRDLGCDRRWMNLQLESEFVGLYLEDIIFDELLHEVVFS